MKARQGNPTPEALARLDDQRVRAGITLEAVAAAAGVSVPTVSRVLHARTKSANVVATVRRMIRDARAAKKTAAA